MFRFVAIVALGLLAGCSPQVETTEEVQPQFGGSLHGPTSDVQSVDLAGATMVRLWATRYYATTLANQPGGIPMRDMQGRDLGPRLSPRDWCAAAMEGTAIDQGKVYNYAGTAGSSQVDCSHDPSERVRFALVSAPYGLGVDNLPLRPFRSLACDIGRATNSIPWLNGGYVRVGQKIFIPAAVGVKLPDGSVHDGVFVCEDMGGKILGNHVDVFVGAVRGGEAGAARMDPFDFVHSNEERTFGGFVLP